MPGPVHNPEIVKVCLNSQCRKNFTTVRYWKKFCSQVCQTSYWQQARQKVQELMAQESNG